MSPPGNSDSDNDEMKTSAFSLRPSSLHLGKELQQKSILRPATLPPPTRSQPPTADLPEGSASEVGSKALNLSSEMKVTKTELRSAADVRLGSEFVFGQNLEQRVKLSSCVDNGGNGEETGKASELSTAPMHNYFLQHVPRPPLSQRAEEKDDNKEKEAAGTVSPSPSSSPSPPSPSGFVFGEDMDKRVVSPVRGEEAERSTTPRGLSLAESAEVYTQSHSTQCCVLREVETLTGEESESNVLQLQCKLFVLETNSQIWRERGRGILRLNDRALPGGGLSSRLVMRNQGSLRVVLNAPLWAGLLAERAGERGLRLAAPSPDSPSPSPRIFLVTGSVKDIGQLYAALHHRLLALRSRANTEGSMPERLGFGVSTPDKLCSGVETGVCAGAVKVDGPGGSEECATKDTEAQTQSQDENESKEQQSDQQ
uniref:RAN binding protein 3b n=1 Tax=Eptatretus burgeri TaxID=7764 RepID=A0A8C4QPE9_EPTBU